MKSEFIPPATVPPAPQQGELWSATSGQADALSASAASSKSQTLDGSRAPLVLLVEDNLINQVVAQEFLSLMGLQCRVASNGFEALSLCSQIVPDLTLMDIQMPGMDGLECARRLRSLQHSGKLAPFPILALTAHALDSDVRASLEAGMNEHLTKPLDFTALRERLSQWLKMPRLND